MTWNRSFTCLDLDCEEEILVQDGLEEATCPACGAAYTVEYDADYDGEQFADATTLLPKT